MDVRKNQTKIALLTGIVSIIAGILALAFAQKTAETFIIIVGIIAIIISLFTIIAAFSTNNIPLVIIGALVLILGIVIVSTPNTFLNLLGYIIGIWFLITGILGLFKYKDNLKFHLYSVIINGLLIIGGVILIIGQGAFGNVVGILIGIWLIIYGISQLLIAFNK